jgi:hypothetical protein
MSLALEPSETMTWQIVPGFSVKPEEQAKKIPTLATAQMLASL